MKWGLNKKFIFYTVFIIVFISLVFSAVFNYQSRAALLEEFNKRANALVQNLALNIEVPLLIENRARIRSLAQNLLKEKEVLSIAIFNQKGEEQVRFDKGKKLFPWQKENITCAVYFSPEREAGTTEQIDLFFSEDSAYESEDSVNVGQVIGNIEVVFSREDIIRALSRMRWWILISATLAAVIGGIAGLYFSRTLIQPILRLAGATSSIARGNWEERLEVMGSDELGQLTKSFNIMAQSLIAKRDQLEQTYRKLAQKEKMAEIGKFSMIIAHELKNPLGIIKGSVDILAKETTLPDIRETMIDYIQDEVKRLDKLIDDFLSFSRPIPPLKTVCDVNTVVRKVADHFIVPEEYDKKVPVSTELGTPPQIEMDENQIYHVLLNLVHNAVHAIEKEGEIILRTGLQDTWVKIEVCDNGPGIDQEIKEKIFEPFFTTKAKGTGLGLAIVNKIVGNHDGYITVNDCLEKGTCFSIFLPSPEKDRR